MKKILAIAVATAISAPAMADMTISGSAGLNFGKDTNGQYGVGFEDFAFNVAGSATAGETTFNASTGLVFVESESNATNAQAKNSLETTAIAVSASNAAWGTFSAVATEAGDAYGVDTMLDQIGYGTYSMVEDFTYTLPAFGATKVGINFSDSVVGENSASYKAYELRVNTALAGAAVEARFRPDDSRFRAKVSGSVDAITAAVGYQTTAAATRTSVALGYAVSEATTLNASYAVNDTGSAAASGFELDVNHALSSNVKVNVGFDSVDGTNTSGASVVLSF